MINSRSGISAYMLLDENISAGYTQHIDINEILQGEIIWGQLEFEILLKKRRREDSPIYVTISVTDFVVCLAEDAWFVDEGVGVFMLGV